MLYATALLALAGLVLAEPQAVRAAKASPTTAAAAAASTGSDFKWVTPGTGVVWANSQGQTVTWTGTTPATFDMYLISPDTGVMPYNRWMPIAQNIPMSWHNLTFTMVFGPDAHFGLFATNHQAAILQGGRSPLFGVSGGNGKYAGFPLASSYMASWAPSTTFSFVPPTTAASVAPAAAPVAAAPVANTPAAAAVAPAAAPIAGAGTSTTYVAASQSGIVAAVNPTSGASTLAISGLGASLLAFFVVAFS